MPMPGEALRQRERPDEVAAEQRGAGEPGDDRRPAEVEERARRDVLGDPRRSAVGRGCLERWNLHEIEVVKQADPHDAGHEMQPSCQCRYEFHSVASLYINKDLTAKYRIAVRISPEMIVPQIESSGFFIVILPVLPQGVDAAGHSSNCALFGPPVSYKNAERKMCRGAFVVRPRPDRPGAADVPLVGWL